MKTCRKCGEQFKTTVIIDGKKRNLRRRVYCLNCSPFGKRNRKILEAVDGFVKLNERHCPRCRKIKPINEFYAKRSGHGFSCYCKKCVLLEAKRRQWAFKNECVQYKGGKCVRCGYHESIAAMDFHHKDPTAKEFTISSVRFLTFDEDIKRELDKCDLLCANCHRVEHSDIEQFEHP